MKLNLNNVIDIYFSPVYLYLIFFKMKRFLLVFIVIIYSCNCTIEESNNLHEATATSKQDAVAYVVFIGSQDLINKFISNKEPSLSHLYGIFYYLGPPL